MTADRSLAAAVAIRLGSWGPVELRRQFGTVALAMDGVMFGFVTDGTLYLRVDEGLRAVCVARGTGPFTYARQGRIVALSNYFAVPAEILDDPERLVEWSVQAHRAARMAPARRRPKGDAR